MHKLLTIKTATVKTLKVNARKHSEKQLAQIRASIERFGFLSPIVIDAEGNCIAGNGRLEAARQLGLESLPAIRAIGLSDDDIRAYALIDNRLAETSDWDIETLKAEIEALTQIEDIAAILAEVGFSEEERETLKIAEAEAIDLEKEPKEKGSKSQEREQYHCPKCGFKFEV